jgi:hypothetical protein
MNKERAVAQTKKAQNRHENPPDVDNPKTHPDPNSNAEKNPDDWVTGHEPMTGAQASYLKTLSEEAGESFNAGMTKAQASQRIDELRERSGRAGR